MTVVRSNPHTRAFENLRVFSRQLLVRVVNHTLLLIRGVSRFSTKYQFSEVKPSHTHFWEPSSLSRQLLVRVVNHTLLLIRSVSLFSTKYQFSEIKPSQSHFSESGSLFLAVTRARSKSNTTPDTECVTILYKISVQWGKTLIHAFLRTSEFVSAVTRAEFVSAVTRARSKSHTTPDTECVTILCTKISSLRSNPHSCTFENHWVCFRQLLVRVVNHTLLLIRSVSRFSTKRSVQWGQTLTVALLRTSEFFLGSYSCA